jgi:predicted acylesterase/phospholipase RssA
MRLFRLGHVDYLDLRRRLFSALKLGFGAFWNVFRARMLPGAESVFFNYADLVGAPFRADGFAEMLRGALEMPGATNDFRQLARKLYIGVTDQDARQHVLFGDEAHDEIPISTAIQASMSLNPAFTATRIRGRYYEDGAVTRTSNFYEAIRRDANLVLVIDPFLPYVSNRAGFAAQRGVLYNIDQDIRTVSYTRFENTRNSVLRRHPDVSSYTFLPANHLRRLLSISPFDHRPFLEIWRGAYLSTLNRILRLRHRMSGDFELHGWKLDTTKAEIVADQLEENEEPTFEDFYPDGRVTIAQPPLQLELPKA